MPFGMITSGPSDNGRRSCPNIRRKQDDGSIHFRLLAAETVRENGIACVSTTFNQISSEAEEEPNKKQTNTENATTLFTSLSEKSLNSEFDDSKMCVVMLNVRIIISDLETKRPGEINSRWHFFFAVVEARIACKFVAQ